MLAHEAAALAYPETHTEPEKVGKILARIRKEEPVIWVEPEGIRPFWLVTKAEDLKFVETHPESFLTEPRPAIIPEVFEEHNLKVYGRRRGPIESLVSTDGARHRQLRMLGQGWFTPTQLKNKLPEIEAITARFVQLMADRQEECDFASDVANLYPLRVINSIMGLPEELDEPYLQLTQKMFSATSNDSGTPGEDRSKRIANSTEAFFEIFRPIIADRIANPRKDLVSHLVNARVDGKPISEMEIAGYLQAAATAGHDTTSSTTACGLLELIRHPEQLQQLRKNPALIPNAVEEFIRWAAPVIHLSRTAVEDIELGGKMIRKGDSLALMFASSCRDDSVFDDADRFRIDRKPNNHLAFGIGPHICLGMHLARLEIAAFFRALLPRLKHIELNGKLSYMPSFFVCRLTSMPIRYSMD